MRIEQFGLAASVVLGLSTLACEPVVPPPFAPPRDSSFDADLDSSIRVLPDRDAPGVDAPRTPGTDVPERDTGFDPDFDGGVRLPIVIDGELLEMEWEGTSIATSTAVGVGAFAGCALRDLRVTYDDVYLYMAVEGVLCNGAIVVYVVDGSGLGVNLTLLPLADDSGEVDQVASRSFLMTDPDRAPRFVWGTSVMPTAASAATDRLGWRELSQSGPHRHFTTDSSACTEELCETRVRRAELGSPTSLLLAVRMANRDDASLLSLPNEFSPDVSLTTFIPIPARP